MSPTYDVAIVGAGPTGLTLACLLGRHGLRVAVLERHHDVYPLPRAVHLDDEVYRILLETGLGDELAAITRPALGLQLLDERHRVLATFARSERTPAGLPQANMFDQPDLEQLLRAQVTHHPSVDLLSGHEVLGLVAHADGVDLTLHDGTLRASYVVGCDGANSMVRAALGIGDRDLGFEQRWLVLDVRTDAELGAWEGVHQVCDPRRAGTYMRIGPERYRWEFQLLDGERAEDFAVPVAARDLVGPWVRDVPDERLEVIRSVEYTFRARVAEHWRMGRVLLAGDAAHLTPPFIGQGMCAGQRDAANLAWKLATAVAGDDTLLESYQAERMPHTVAMIRRAVHLGRVMTGGGRAAAVVRRSLVPPLSRTSFVRETLLDSRTPPLRPGPLVARRTPSRVRGALLPLVSLPGPDGADLLIDRLLGLHPAIVALPGVDAALVPDTTTWLTVDPSGSTGERLLADWLTAADVDWVRVDPDRVVRRAGRARWAA